MARPGFMVTFEFMNRHAMADDRSIGAWLRLQTHSAQTAGGGRIRDCRAWPKGRWDREVRVHPKALEKAIEDGLAVWDGDDLVIADYDHQGEKYYANQSALAKKGAEAKWKGHSGDAPGIADGIKNKMPPALPTADAHQQGKAKYSKAEQSEQGGHGDVRSFARALSGLFLPDTDKAIFQWDTLVSVEAEERGPILDRIRCLEWIVEEAREDGVTVKYPEEVLTYAHRWRNKNRREAQAASAAAGV